MKPFRALALGFALCGAAAGPALAQQFTQNQVSAGEYGGELTTRHPTLTDGSYADCMLLPTQPGRTYTLTMRSQAFDTYLLADPNGCNLSDAALSNDDFERNSTDSQLSFVGTGASFGIFVNSYGAGATGRFRLSIAESGQAASQQVARTPAPPPNTPEYAAAWAAFERDDYTAAARLFRPFADAGDHSAQNAMGFMYFFGRGVSQNRLEAGRWYGLAAEQGNEQAQRALNDYAAHIMEARFVDHIDRHGPDTTDSGTFHYDVSVYCIYRGPNCQSWQVRARQFEDARNRAAEAANMRRIWGLYGGDSAEAMRASRARSECLRRVTESINRQTYGQQTWRYVNNC
jgi:TPR repeat protein